MYLYVEGSIVILGGTVLTLATKTVLYLYFRWLVYVR